MKEQERADLGRIVAFTDGVMAVAITLLVLNIDVPNVANDELGQALVDLVPSLGAYVLSFALIGRYWVVHHGFFETLIRFDGRLMALNLVFLALIALMPFATDLMDRYNEQSLAAAVFGATIGLAALVNWLMHEHTVRAGLVSADLVDEGSVFASPTALGFAVVFLASVPLAFISPHIAQALWVSTIVLRYPLRRLTGRTSSA
jgi:uncharacterized membrane protein